MALIRNILFPVDFSPACAGMAPFVKKAKALFSAKVTLLHVLSPAASGFELLVRPLPEVEEDRVAGAQAALASFLAREFPAASNRRLLTTGDAAARIAEVARDGRFDLITMPTHAGVFRRTLLGSTTAKVLNDSACPMLTTQHAETLKPRPLEHREWVCALGLQPDSERVLRYASELAAGAHANLTLVHAIQTGERGAVIRFDLEERLRSAERTAARRRLEALQKKAGSSARMVIALGPVKAALVEALKRLQADALFIGRSPQASVRLRDLTYALVRDAPCPVLSI